MEHKIFVGGLNYNTTDLTLEEIFSKYGRVISVRVVRDHETGRSRGFAFVLFESESAVINSLELDNTKLEGRVIGVKKAFDKRK